MADVKSHRAHAAARAPDTPDYRAIYDEVVRFNQACARDRMTLSDTWVHSLKRKGTHYRYDEMLTMRRPGSLVTLHINIFDYFVDRTRVDPANPIVAALLARGESDVGRPLKDVPIDGQRFSSVYLKHLDIAAEIIAHLSAKEIERPTILEIGGGQGLLLAALRAWYGGRLTVIAADIPETLFYQAYFLRASFPDAPATYKADAADVTPVRGGFNFVNAYVLSTQHYEIDAAINANSMQEMTAAVANDYLTYIDRVIAPHGTLFFRNSFGHALDSATEPSEYAFGPRWRLVRAGFGDFFSDSSATEFASFIFDRTPEPQDEDRRRLALRTLWNGFAAGQLTPGGETARKLIAGNTAAFEGMHALQSDVHLPSPDYGDTAAPADLAEGDARWRRLTVIRLMQKRLAAAMDAVASRDDVVRLVETFLDEARHAQLARSDYWTGYAACILVGLGFGETANPLLLARAQETDAGYWRLRFAWLLARAGYVADAAQIMTKLPPAAIDAFWWPMAALVSDAVGNEKDALRWLDAAAAHAGDQGTDELRLCLFRANVRLRRLDAAAAMFDALTEPDPSHRAGSRLNLIAFLLRTASGQQGLARRLLQGLSPAPASSPLLAEVLYRLGDHAAALEMNRSLERQSWDSYYALGGIARSYLAMDADADAERCMERSAALRPGAVRHFDFLANVSFEAERFGFAARWFERLLIGKPYDHVYRGRAAYARLPAAVRASDAFGAPADQPMIFQTYQSFYYPDGPQIR